MTDRPKVFIGFTPTDWYETTIAEASIRGNCRRTQPDLIRISRLSLWQEYTRPTTTINRQLWDVISDAPMSTDHAIARFWVPRLCDYAGWALFIDGDVLLRCDITEIFDDFADDRYAVRCVQHAVTTPTRSTKKTGQIQTTYPRKNWSSVMLFNCGHPANALLTRDVLNTWPGRDLHAFNWLTDDQIGALPPEWNYLVGVNPPMADPKLVHYTLGVPALPGHIHDPFADEWFHWAKVAGYADRVASAMEG